MYDFLKTLGCVFAVFVIIAIIILFVMKDNFSKIEAKWIFIASAVCVVLASGCFWGAHQTAPRCPNCGAIANSSYCEQCGEAVAIEPACPDCGAECDTPFCGACGSAVSQGE